VSGRIITPADMGPRIVSIEELRRVCLPICAGYAWGLGTIVDLWKKGAPVPQRDPHAPERRVLLPGQFRKWYEDVAQRKGLALSGEVAYATQAQKLRTSSG